MPSGHPLPDECPMEHAPMHRHLDQQQSRKSMFYVTSLESAHDCDMLLLVGDPDFYAKMGHSVRSGDVPGWGEGGFL